MRGEQCGVTNLFHSFSEFSVLTGGGAFFNNGLQIQNILTRVTGNSVSNIDGLIRANGTANLFLLNPNGISFGARARLNLGGSFFASTASSLVFADGTVFSAKPDTSTSPLLTLSVPFGLQYTSNPESIQVQGTTLRVKSGKTLALVGGNVSLSGGLLLALGGRVELGGLAREGIVGLVANGSELSLSFPVGVPRGDVSLSNGSVVDVTAGGGGSIGVNAFNLTMTQESELLAGIGSGRGSVDTVGGNIEINATGAIDLTDESYISNDVLRGAKGQGGDVYITTSQLRVSGGAAVSAGTRGEGNGGNLTVNADQDVQLIGTTADGQDSSVLGAAASPGSSGNAGDVTINTGTLLVRDGAQVGVSTFGERDGGNLTVNASQGVQLIGESADGKIASGLYASTEPGASGNAGDLTINTSTFLVRDGAQVLAGTFSEGDGGKLTVNANQQVQLIGTSADGQYSSGLFASAKPDASGKAGDLTINTGTLLVRDGATVTVSHPTGQAGNMTILANSMRLNRGSLLAQTALSGSEGGANITLTGLDLLRMDNESLISANALDQANGGNITIDSTLIVATPHSGSYGSDITANAGKGNGGAVNITTQGLFGIEFRPQLTPKNDITVSSEFGENGTFQLTTPGVDPSRGLSNLPTGIIDASNQIVQNCRAVTGEGQQENKFIITGRGGIPPSPNEPLHNDEVITPNWVTLDSEVENNTPPTPTPPKSSTPEPLMEANGWIINEKGQIELLATAPNVTPHGTWQPPVNCRQVSQTDSQ